jgi:hypothetical protein
MNKDSESQIMEIVAIFGTVVGVCGIVYILFRIFGG